jgi:cell division septation protein DedD
MIGGEDLMSLRRTCVILMSAALLASASGCSHEQRDWQSAEAANTIEAYQEFVGAHPQSTRATDAQARIADLTEQRDWQRASTTDTADAYRQFLAQHPQGKSASEARIRIENFGLGGTGAGPAATPAPASAATPAGTATPAAAAVTPSPPKAAAAAQESAGSYSVQLGAFTTRAKAQGQWRRLSARFASELHGTVPDIERVQSASGGHVYRLKAKPLTEGRARALCAALRKHSQACVLRKG